MQSKPNYSSEPQPYPIQECYAEERKTCRWNSGGKKIQHLNNIKTKLHLCLPGAKGGSHQETWGTLSGVFWCVPGMDHSICYTGTDHHQTPLSSKLYFMKLATQTFERPNCWMIMHRKKKSEWPLQLVVAVTHSTNAYPALRMLWTVFCVQVAHTSMNWGKSVTFRVIQKGEEQKEGSNKLHAQGWQVGCPQRKETEKGRVEVLRRGTNLKTRALSS